MPRTGLLYAWHESGHERQPRPVAVVNGHTGQVLSGIFPAELAPSPETLAKLYPGMHPKLEPVYYAGRANGVADTEQGLSSSNDVYRRGGVATFPFTAHWLPTPIGGAPQHPFLRPPMYPTPQNLDRLVHELRRAGPLWP